ncbi:flippase [uncultured Vibrio sp.]|uniref:flippase n=1 Tax=uncultured Vibrio sp. TaxID=114054 RepID=UPI002AABD0B7|nr:flippase [uncultured Vibrio sp.]
MLDRVLIKNIGSLFFTKFAGYLIPLVSLPYLVRTLTPEGYGILGFTLAIINYFVMFVNFGFDLSATKRIANSSTCINEISKIYWNVISIKSIFSISGLIILFFINNMFFSQQDGMLLYLAYISVMGAVIYPQWLFQGKESLGFISIFTVVTQLFSLVLYFICVNDSSDVDLAILINSLQSVVVGIIACVIIYQRRWIVYKKPEWKFIKQLTLDSFNLFVSTSAISFYTTSSSVILGFISGPVAVGYFVAANKLVSAVNGMLSPLFISFYPRINKELKVSKEAAVTLIRYVMKLQFYVSMPLVIMIFFLSPFIVNVLYGDDYIESVTILRILCVVPLVVGFSNIFAVQVLITFGYSHEYRNNYIISAIIGMIMIIFFTKWYGTEGLSVAIVLIEMLVVMLMARTIVRKNIPLFKS